MKVNELRVGNLVNMMNRSGKIHMPYEHPFKVVAILIDVVSVIEPNEILAQIETPKFIEHFNTSEISITDDWLIKFGFEKTTYEWFIEWFSGNYHYSAGEGCKIGQPIKYVHQLQNLYYIITGSELTIV